MRRLTCSLLASLIVATPARGELTHGAALAAVYDTILAGRFEAAERDLASACPPALFEACQAMRGAILWWRIALNPENRSLDAALEREAHAAIDAAAAWTRREPESADAWFYHAAAHAPLVQWRLLRRQRLPAVREASRIKSSLERALALDPQLHDAHFGIGLYRYYAGIAPVSFRLLRWLLWLPGGDREQGLRQMEEARQRGQLLRGEADYQLHFVYLWYEDQPERALELLEGLHARYPSNPRFLERLAEVQRDHVEDYYASVESWERLIERARRGEVALPRVSEVHAGLGLAETLDRMSRTDRALDVLTALIDSGADVSRRGAEGAKADPPDGLARAHLQRAAAYDRLGDRARALQEYNAAHRHAPAGETGDALRELARQGLAGAPDAQDAEAYRLAVNGRQALERGEPDRAARLLAQSVAMEPDDLVARYWYASALGATDRRQQAAELLDAVVHARPPAPSFVLASALTDLAAFAEGRGDVARAIDLYRRALETRGGAPDARAEARAALQRLAP